MRRELKIILILILIVIFLIFAYFVIDNYRISKHNEKIDYSCNLNEDCVIKTVGRGVCGSVMQRCVNANSVSAILKPVGGRVVCEAIDTPPEKCECIRNTCISFSCYSEDDCFVKNSPGYNRKDFE